MAKLPFSIIITLILSSFYLTAQDYSNFDCPVEVNGRQLASSPPEPLPQALYPLPRPLSHFLGHKDTS